MATIIDGKMVANEILEQVTAEIAKEKLTPRLAIVMVGDDPGSQIYVRLKEKACARVGIVSKNYCLPAKTTQEELLKLVRKLNNGPDNGILVQIPLPKHIDPEVILEAVDPEKDIDGLTEQNLGRLFFGTNPYPPCTPGGVLKLLDRYGISIEGKDVVMVGRSKIVGKPVAMMLTNKNATVTLCHSKTKNLAEHTKRAEILVVAVGRPKMFKANMVREEAVVIDVGINRVDGKVVGDVDFESVKEKASYITPVPGGVGPMTIAMLMKNTLRACQRQKAKG
ncbi:MAG: bifunctional methylenetetrahydrofolate dehydrogenase/methenyltetrahydrofolate cyclohydrolase FolD [Candidatus Micrarchaeota archaeon]